MDDVQFFKNNFFVSCPIGIETLLEKEISTLYPTIGIEEHRGGLALTASLPQIFSLLLQSRLASRIYKKIYSFSMNLESSAPSQNGKGGADLQSELYDGLFQYNWDWLFPVTKSFKIQTLAAAPIAIEKNFHRGRRPPGAQNHNTLFLSKVAKDAIVDKFRERTQARPEVNTQFPEVPILLYLSPPRDKKILCEVLVDLSGAPLGNRHYKSTSSEAPVRENLAAAIIQLMDWKPEEGEIFNDLMVGSGTVLIEAIMKHNNIPPSFPKIAGNFEKGEKRRWALEHLEFVSAVEKNKDYWQKAQEQSYQMGLHGTKTLIKNQSLFRGFDLNPESVALTKNNLRQCLLPNSVDILEEADARTVNSKKSEAEKGVVFCNPPYGIRLGNEEDLKALYYELGENLKGNFQNYRAYILTANPELRKCIHLRTKERIPLKNGNLDCRLLRYDLF
jgi:putative N6-adenine-specific DNA methylase